MAQSTMPCDGTRPAGAGGTGKAVGAGGWISAWLTGAVALVAEGTLALIVFGIVALQGEDAYFAGAGASLGWILGAVLGVVAAALAGLTGSAAVVLPVLRLSRRSARRAGRADTALRCLAVCAVLAVVTGAVAGAVGAVRGDDAARLLLVAPVVFLVLSPAVLCARAATVVRGPGARVAVPAVVGAAGGALSAVALAAGVVAYATGTLELYEPPRLTEEQLVGTWTDDRGGTLTLRADGTAVADDLGAEDRCSGSGTWERTERGSEPELLLLGDGCPEESYAFSGTAEHPSLYHLFGDVEAPGRYVLRRD
ncbi:hypothetical protein [Streptomyces sp. bgisy022]|uniref:hypothetical protein n=1 Tax=Streptomyces sp. bgisy022 TaxID=3413769 RepID=UPI003D757585